MPIEYSVTKEIVLTEKEKSIFDFILGVI